MMNILTLLKKDHQTVDDLLNQLMQTSTRAVKTRKSIFEKIKSELLLHEKIEETIFYPPLKKNPETKDLIMEAYEEHHFVNKIMAEIETVSPDHETWKFKVKVLMENIQHHVHEEEDNLFPKVKKILSIKILNEMGIEMEKAKSQKSA